LIIFVIAVGDNAPCLWLLSSKKTNLNAAVKTPKGRAVKF
jgi:hypothetical protein